MNRPRLPDDEIDRIRHDRYMPQPTHWHYLHLAGLLRGLTRTLERLSDVARCGLRYRGHAIARRTVVQKRAGVLDQGAQVG